MTTSSPSWSACSPNVFTRCMASPGSSPRPFANAVRRTLYRWAGQPAIQAVRLNSLLPPCTTSSCSACFSSPPPLPTSASRSATGRSSRFTRRLQHLHQRRRNQNHRQIGDRRQAALSPRGHHDVHPWICAKFLPFDARAESVYRVKDGQMVVHTERSNGKKPTDTTLTFDYAETHHRGLPGPDSSGQKSNRPAAGRQPDGSHQQPHVQARAWQLKPGETIDALVMFEEEPYELTFHAEGYEKVKTSLGTFNTLVLVPKMERPRRRACSSAGSTVRVWISQDNLPVKFEVEFKFGSGVATLVKYNRRPPPRLRHRSLDDRFLSRTRQRRRVKVEPPRFLRPNRPRVIHADARRRLHQGRRGGGGGWEVLDQSPLAVCAGGSVEAAGQCPVPASPRRPNDSPRSRGSGPPPASRGGPPTEVQHLMDAVTEIHVPDGAALGIQDLRPPRAPKPA